ncbi:MAG: adenosine kinase [Candidatus Kapaibacteriales bacterium]
MKQLNKDIQLSAIGNALVDIQIESTEAELEDSGFEKGTMTLVDKDKQTKAMEKMEGRKNHLSSGGSAANTVIAFSELGGKSGYATAIGNDDLGRFYESEFQNLGIVLSAKQSKNLPTGTCLLYITPDAERTQATYLGANEEMDENTIDTDMIRRSEWLYVEGYKLSSEDGFAAANEAIKQAKKFNTKIALTLSDKFIVDIFGERVESIMKDVNLVFCNEMEAKAFTGKDNVEDAYEVMNSSDYDFVLTKSGKGSVASIARTKYEFDAVKTEAIDTTGAGDMYAAGFMYGLLCCRSIEAAGRIASLTASKVVSQFGARLKTSQTTLRDEVLYSLNMHKVIS